MYNDLTTREQRLGRKNSLLLDIGTGILMLIFLGLLAIIVKGLF